jgi:hypothetical protein
MPMPKRRDRSANPEAAASAPADQIPRAEYEALRNALRRELDEAWEGRRKAHDEHFEREMARKQEELDQQVAENGMLRSALESARAELAVRARQAPPSPTTSGNASSQDLGAGAAASSPPAADPASPPGSGAAGTANASSGPSGPTGPSGSKPKSGGAKATPPVPPAPSDVEPKTSKASG